MNYFDLHIGDITEATAHLSMLEDGAYNRMLRKYYATERPLPADLKTVQRLIGARSKEEREAVEVVLEEFFELQDDGWHQSRCDAVIAEFHEKQVGKEGAKEGAKERQRRARERRKSLFDQLRGHGQVPAFDTTTVELEAMLSRVTDAPPSPHVTPPVTRDDTATHTPVPSPSTQYPTEDSADAPSSVTGTQVSPGEACMAMKQAGLAMVSPSNQQLIGLLQAGITVSELVSAVVDYPGKPLAYVLKAAESRRREAASIAALPPAPPPRQSAADARRASEAHVIAGLTGRKPERTDHGNRTVDVESRVV